MKKLIFLFIIALSFGFVSQAQVSAPRSFGAYLAALDTLTNADNTTISTTISGNKTVVTYQIHVLKISGTVAGTIKLYISADGINYPSAASDSLTLADASGQYQIRRTNNPGQKTRIVVATTGTSSASDRVYLFWRD